MAQQPPNQSSSELSNSPTSPTTKKAKMEFIGGYAPGSVKKIVEEQMRNEAHIWGYKYPSPSTMEVHEVRVNQTSKDTFSLTKTTVERDTTIYTSIDAKARGDGTLSKLAFPKRQFQVCLAGKLNADGVVLDIEDTVNLNLSKYALNENLIIVAKDYDPIQDKMTYDVAYYGSAARFIPLDLVQQFDNLGRIVNRLIIQSAQR